MNLYQWESRAASRFEARGDGALTWLLLLSALAIILIALFCHNAVFKALVLAYVVLP